MKKTVFQGIACFAIVVFMSECKKYDAPAAPVAAGTEIHLANSDKFGTYFTNQDGLSLYMFAGDADGTNACAGACASTWPPFTADLSKIKLDAGLNAADFHTVTISGGAQQVTFKGWPLYAYAPSANDGYGNISNMLEAPGATGGDGVDGLRFIAKPNYTIMLANNQLTGFDGINYKSDYTVGTGNTTYFTDASGRTLYTFIQDSFNINKFTLPDLSNNDIFPIYEEGDIVVPSIIDHTLFGSIVAAGKLQLTYHGWPLYHFGQDIQRGFNKGITVPAVGVWPVAIKDLPEAKKPNL